MPDPRPLVVPQLRLDFLRGIAATYVVVNHVRGHFFIGGRELLSSGPSILDYITVAMLQATSLGFEMVVLFFVLSGFAMAHSIDRSSSTVSFYLKRVVRIWPPYIAACVLAAGVGLIVGVQIDLLPMLFYTSVSTPLTPQFWSLPYEVVFYALCPLIVPRPRLFLLAAACLCLFTIIVRGSMLNPWPNLGLNFIGNEALLFACGVMSYRYLDRVPALSGKLLCLACLAAAVGAWAIKHWLGGNNIWSALAVVGASVLLIRNLPDRVAAFKPTNWGFFSYSIYVFHFALVALLQWAMGGTRSANPLAWMLALPPVLIGCFLLYLVTERVSNGWVRRIRRAKPRLDVASETA